MEIRSSDKIMSTNWSKAVDTLTNVVNSLCLSGSKTAGSQEMNKLKSTNTVAQVSILHGCDAASLAIGFQTF
jgi:hypothetical protein